MRGLSVVCFLVALPFLAVLGHDVYVTYQDQDLTREMMFSNLGYLWTSYGPESYKWAQDNIDKATWDSILVPVLKVRSVLATGVPAALFYALLGILKLLNLPPFSDGTRRFGHGPKKAGFSFKSTDPEKGRFKYKRK